jgi:hypothetical protein
MGVVDAGQRLMAAGCGRCRSAQLTATINHSPTGDPKKVSEMFGYAESTPIDIRDVVVELEAPKD